MIKTSDLIWEAAETSLQEFKSSSYLIEYARKNGVKVLITDHHLPAKELPNADVIINPQLANDKFPSKNLAGVGVIFYILLASQ